MATAGFGPNEIELVQQGNILWVSGQKGAEQDHQEMLHRGLAFRNFKQSFSLADHVKVTAASLENGLLTVELMREVPEQLKPRRIEVVSPTATLPSQNRPPEIAQAIGAERKVA
jgi:molecular chaperone IbpA